MALRNEVLQGTAVAASQEHGDADGASERGGREQEDQESLTLHVAEQVALRDGDADVERGAACEAKRPQAPPPRLAAGVELEHGRAFVALLPTEMHHPVEGRQTDLVGWLEDRRPPVFGVLPSLVPRQADDPALQRGHEDHAARTHLQVGGEAGQILQHHVVRQDERAPVGAQRADGGRHARIARRLERVGCCPVDLPVGNVQRARVPGASPRVVVEVLEPGADRREVGLQLRPPDLGAPFLAAYLAVAPAVGIAEHEHAVAVLVARVHGRDLGNPCHDGRQHLVEAARLAALEQARAGPIRRDEELMGDGLEEAVQLGLDHVLGAAHQVGREPPHGLPCHDDGDGEDGPGEQDHQEEEAAEQAPADADGACSHGSTGPTRWPAAASSASRSSRILRKAATFSGLITQQRARLEVPHPPLPVEHDGMRPPGERELRTRLRLVDHDDRPGHLVVLDEARERLDLDRAILRVRQGRRGAVPPLSVPREAGDGLRTPRPQRPCPSGRRRGHSAARRPRSRWPSRRPRPGPCPRSPRAGPGRPGSS